MARVTRYWYSSQGSLRYTVDAEGYVKRFDYDKEERLVREVAWAKKIIASDKTAIGKLSALVKEAGQWRAIRYTYDNAGRRASMYDGEGNRTVWSWHNNGLLRDEYVGYTDSKMSDADRSRKQYFYDGAGRLIRSISAHNTKEVTNTYTSYDGLGNVISVTDPNGKKTRFSYDKSGRVLTETNAAGGVIRYEYNAFGEVVKATDPNGNATYNYYDNLGRVTKSRDAENYITETAYNSFGEVKSITRRYTKTKSVASTTILPSVSRHAKDATTRFEYDKRGLLTKTTDAEGYFETFTYNAFGDRVSSRAKSATSAKKPGALTTYTYDKRGLLTSEKLPISSYHASGLEEAKSVVNRFEYDARGNRVKLIEAAGLNEQRITTYVYDKADRLIETRGQARTVARQGDHSLQNAFVPIEKISYDARGNITRTIDALGAKTLFFYDDLDRKVFEINARGTLTAYGYDKNGNVTRITIYAQSVRVPADGGAKSEAPTPPKGAKRETLFTFDALNRMTKSSIVGVETGYFNGTRWVASSGSIDTRYEYDANGNVIKTIDPMGGTIHAYYDKLGRKTGQVDALNYFTKWSYDAEGNVVRETAYAVPLKSKLTNKLPSSPSTANARITEYSYDKVGNRLTESRLNVLVHDGNGSHKNVSRVTVSYLYNGMGQVVRKTEAVGNKETKLFWYDGGGRLYKERSASYVGHTGKTVTPEIDYYYDGLGNLSRVRAKGAEGTAERVTTYTYNAGGLLSKVIDPQGHQRLYYYDANGRQIIDRYVRTESSGKTHTEGTLTKYDRLGRVIEQKVARLEGGTWLTDTAAIGDDGVVKTTKYNSYGDAIVTQVNGVRIAANRYNAAGKIVASQSGDGIWKFFRYDKNGNQTLALTSAGRKFTSSTSIQSVIDLIDQTNVNATYTVYDKRNMAVRVHEEQRQLSAGVTRGLNTTRQYNAFGEVIRETDARGATISYTYNNMGRMIRSEGPTVQITEENGDTKWVKPSEDFYYDASGRLVAQRDSNGFYAGGGQSSNGTSKAANTGNLTKFELLAGSGFDGSEALITKQINADNGEIESQFDIHGDARKTRVLLRDNPDPAKREWRETTQQFDKLGRLIKTIDPAGLQTQFSYDELGQRTAVWNSFQGSNNKRTSDYDKQGRLIRTRDFGGDITKVAYRWNANLSPVGLDSFGGWVQTTTYANTRTMVRSIDLYERETRKVDLAGKITHYTYDHAGRLTGLTARTSNISYTYYNTGLISTHIKSDGLVSKQTVLESQFGYDEGGNLLSEKLSRAVNRGPRTYDYTHTPDLARNAEPLLFKLFNDNGVDPDGDAITLVGFRLLNSAGQEISQAASSVDVEKSGENYLRVTANGRVGKVTIEYTLKDEHNQSAIGTITVNVANIAPVAKPHTIFGVVGGESKEISASDVARDPDGLPKPLTFLRAGFTTNPGASVRISDDGKKLIVTGNASSLGGSGTLSWTVSDGDKTISGTSLILVSKGTTAVDDIATLAFRKTVTVDVLANDSAPSGRTKVLTAAVSSDSTALQAKIENNKIVLTHLSGAGGNYTVTYTMSDGVSTRTAKINVTVSANKAPQVSNYSFPLSRHEFKSQQVTSGSDSEGHGVSIHSIEVLYGRGSELTAVKDPANANNIKLTHVSGVGSYVVRYRLIDQYGAISGYGYITTNVANQPPVEKKPMAILEVAVGESREISASEVASDSDGPSPLIFLSADWKVTPGFAIASMRISDNGKLIVTAGASSGKSGVISWTVSDGDKTISGFSFVTVTKGTTAVDDTAKLAFRKTATVDVLANDYAAGGRAKVLKTAVSSDSTALQATIENNKVVVKHLSGAGGTYTVTYTMSDGVSTKTAKINVTVSANRAPTGAHSTVDLAYLGSQAYSVTSGFDLDGHATKIVNLNVLDGKGSELQAIVDPSDPRNISVKHVSGYGTYTVQYQLEDIYGARSRVYSLIIAVSSPTNRNPVISNPNIVLKLGTISFGETIPFSLEPYLSDPDGDPVKIISATASLTEDRGRSFPFVGVLPSKDWKSLIFSIWSYASVGTVTYTVEDGKGGTATGKIQLSYIVDKIGPPAPSEKPNSAANGNAAFIDVSTGKPRDPEPDTDISVDWTSRGVGGISGGSYNPTLGVLRQSTATYDALGRLTTWQEKGGANTPSASKQLYYDANGNIRRSKATYAKLNDQGNKSGSVTTDHWFAFDSMNRLVVDKGVRSGDRIKISNGKGTLFSYDKAGQRISATTYKRYTARVRVDDIRGIDRPTYTTHSWSGSAGERYTYDRAGRLERVSRTSETAEAVGYNPNNGRYQFIYSNVSQGLSKFRYNALGKQTLQEDMRGGKVVFSQITSYNNSNGRVSRTDSSVLRDGKTERTITNYHYGSYGALNLGTRDIPTGSVTATSSTNYSDGKLQKSSTTYNSYTFFDGAVQNGIRHIADNKKPSKTTTTGFVLDGGGNILRAVIQDTRSRTVNYTHDISGQVIERREADKIGSKGDPRDIWYRFGGKEMGHITNNGAGYHDSYADSITDRTAKPGDPSKGPFHNASETGTFHADFDYSSSRFTSFNQGSSHGSYTARAGDTLQSIAAQQYGDANLWYKIAQANGLTSGQAALGEGQIITLPAGVSRTTYNASTFKPYDPGQAIGDVSPGAPTPPKGNKCGVFGQILLAVVAVAVTALTKGIFAKVASPFLKGFLIGGVASAASQAVGVATGIQSKFSFKGVALAALSGGIGAGGTNLAEGVSPTSLRGIGTAAYQAARNNLITQGIGLVTGLQSKFSFAGVAAAGVSAGVGQALGAHNLAPLEDAGLNLRNGVSHLAIGAARGIASAATRSAITGSSFGKSLEAAIPDVIGSVLGKVLVGAIKEIGRSESEAQPHKVAQAAANGNAPLNQVSQPAETVNTNPSNSLQAPVGQLTEESLELLSAAASSDRSAEERQVLIALANQIEIDTIATGKTPSAWEAARQAQESGQIAGLNTELVDEPWSDERQRRFEDYFAKNRATLSASGIAAEFGIINAAEVLSSYRQTGEIARGFTRRYPTLTEMITGAVLNNDIGTALVIGSGAELLTPLFGQNEKFESLRTANPVGALAGDYGGLLLGVGAVTAGALKYSAKLSAKGRSVVSVYARKYAKLYRQAEKQVDKALTSGRLQNLTRQPDHLFRAQRIDDSARKGLKRFAASRDDGPDIVLINKRFYLNGDSGPYRIPDVRFPQSGIILDGTVGTKTASTPQIKDFWIANGGKPIGIVQPQGSTWLTKKGSK